MGCRGNIVVKYNDERVCLYSHWKGDELINILKTSLERGKSRLDDFQYITRIIFCDMINGHESELTGYGITQNIWDSNGYDIHVDINKQIIKYQGSEISIVEFLKGK